MDALSSRTTSPIFPSPFIELKNSAADVALENALCLCGHDRNDHSVKGCNICEKCKGFEPSGVDNQAIWPITLKCSFIEPGLVHYEDVGTVLVRKEALDKFANSFVGKPVVNEDHREVAPEEFEKGGFQGIVNSVWFDPADGMFHCSYQVWDKKTIQNCRSGYKVSCAYRVKKWGPGGVHNNMPYEREVLEGEYTHLAIVANPRYEGVRIYNSKEGNVFLKWLSKVMQDGKETTLENSVEGTDVKFKDSTGAERTLAEAIEAFNSIEKKKADDAAAAKAADALKNKAPKPEDVFDIGNGKTATFKDLCAALEARNEEEDEEKKKKEDEKKNALLSRDHEAGQHKVAVENCALCNDLKNKKGNDHFQKMDDLNNKRPDLSVDEAPVRHDGLAEGARKFGSVKSK